MELDVLELMPDAVLVVDRRGHVVFINRAGEALFGYERGEVLGRPMEVLLPSRFREDHRRHRERYAGQPHVRPMGLGLELRALTKEGHEVPVEISLAPAQFGADFVVLAAVRDVTERKRLRRRRERRSGPRRRSVAATRCSPSPPTSCGGR